uniref:RING-type domain-containing protein n=1 Tax=Daphnia galeata TaxID=27404 RepID=A0A8J2WHM8_9CRUS|nr:unnamed protein product [Daphnia galeata]
MDWIHCNDCYKQPYSSPKTLFVLTSCARIQCSDCNLSNSCVHRDCNPCRSQNYNAVPLDKSLPSDVEDFFRDPIDILKRYLKVCDFQRGHRDRLFKRHNEQQKQIAAHSAQTSQFQKTITDLQRQAVKTLPFLCSTVQKLTSEIRAKDQEFIAMESKLREVENAMAKERRSQDLFQNLRNNPADPKTRIAPTPALSDRTSDDRNSIQWQQKVPGIPVNPSDRPGPTRQRYIPTQQHQPYKTRAQQFLNFETPSYFYSTSTPAPVARASLSNNITPRNPISSFPTPTVHRPRQSTVAAPMPHQAPKQQQIHPAQQQKRGVSYNRVYAFMSEAARQALTPEVPQGKK